MAFDPVSLSTLAGEAVQGRFYRFIRARYANAPTSMVGAIKSGGRYNVRGAFGALYLGFDEATCRAEVSQGIAAGLPFKPGAFVLWQYDVRLRDVVRLDDPAVQAIIGVTRADITQKGDRQWASQIGEPLYLKGSEGLVAPSAHRVNGLCLDVFLDNIHDGCAVDADRRVKTWP